MTDEQKIRPATPEDAAELLEIYTPYVRDTAISFELEPPTEEEFARRIKAILERYPYIVAEKNGSIAAYAYASAFKKRAAYDTSVEMSIYVREEFRGRGFGKLLYTELERILRLQNVQNVNACIAYTDDENDPYLTNGSTRFHERMGYALVGRFHKCAAKFGRWYDMIWMEKFIGSHETPPPQFKKISEL